MLQFLLEIDGALGDSYPFGHNGNDLHGLPFQDRTCGGSVRLCSGVAERPHLFLPPHPFLWPTPLLQLLQAAPLLDD